MSQEILSRLGYDDNMKISSLADLKAFKSTPEDYDLVLTDQIMAELSAAELLGQIRSIRSDIPIIICTGYSNQMNEKKAQILGINEFAYKTLIIKDIATLIRREVDG